MRTRVNEIEARYEKPPVNVKVERGSTFTFTPDLPYIFSILFYARKIYVRTHVKIRDGGNPPYKIESLYERPTGKNTS